MPNQDILFRMETVIFSYRVAGILIREGKVLLQRPVNDTSYAFPGGHVNLGETSAEALVREFREEVAADILPTRLMWVMENFFPWGEKPCHQLAFYYLVELRDLTQIPLEGRFLMPDEQERKISNLEFAWVPLADLDTIQVYPLGIKEKLLNPPEHLEHWVYSQYKDIINKQ